MGDGWVLLIDETLVSRVPPTSCRPPRCALAAGEPQAASSNKEPCPRAGTRARRSAPGSASSRAPGENASTRGGGGGEKQMTLFSSKVTRSLCNLLITRASELEFHG